MEMTGEKKNWFKAYDDMSDGTAHFSMRPLLADGTQNESEQIVAGDEEYEMQKNVINIRMTYEMRTPCSTLIEQIWKSCECVLVWLTQAILITCDAMQFLVFHE